MSRTFTFLVNPASGGGRASGAVVPVARVLRDHGARVTVEYSPGVDAVGALVEAAVARGDVVVSVGGDGMLSSVAGEVAARDGVLAVLPAGRGNDFARMVGVPLPDDDRAAMLLDGPVTRVDLVEVTAAGEEPRVVAGSVYAGVDARAAAHVARMRRVPTRAQYPLAAVQALATYRPADLEVVLDGAARRFRAATVVVANSAYYGKGMRIAPGAALDDGLLDVVVIEAASRMALVRALPLVYDGRHVDRPEVTVLRGREVTLAADPPLPAGADGEPLGLLPRLGAAPLAVAVRPGALALVCP